MGDQSIVELCLDKTHTKEYIYDCFNFYDWKLMLCCVLKTRQTRFRQSSMIRLKTYTSEPIKVWGEFTAVVQYGGQTKSCSVIVVDGQGLSLVGRDWLSKFNLVGSRVVNMCREPVRSNLLEEYAEVFSGEPSKIQPFEAKLVLKENVQPVFCRPRSVPFAIKGAVEQELERLEKGYRGIIVKVSHSDYPIVPVVKANHQLRVCGDFKVTLNPVLDIEQYPLPKPENLFATLAGGKKFTKIDLTNAYLQLPWNEQSKKLCTVNTHKGLFSINQDAF